VLDGRNLLCLVMSYDLFRGNEQYF
jgi:hypothetical protein